MQALLTGIPGLTQIAPGAPPTDTLKINLGVAPNPHPSRFGVLAGDTQGFPNGRRLTDDVVDIEERVVGGFLKGNKLPLGDGVDQNDKPFRTTFPYVASPARRLRLAAEADRARARPRPRRPHRGSLAGRHERAAIARSPPARLSMPPPHAPHPHRLRRDLRRRAPRHRADRRAMTAAQPPTANRRLPPAPRPSDPTDVRIAKLQATVRAAPVRADGWTLLAGAYLQKVRETGDAGFYARAQGAVDRAPRAAARRPRCPDPAQRPRALAPRLQRRPAPTHAGPARAAPMVDQPFGALVDALVELGRYQQAGRALQEMVDRKPDLAAYARVSYFRELHGDLRGALRAMRAAVSAGGAVPEQDAYVRSLLGDLELQAGQIDAAVRDYRGALSAMPGYPAAAAGLAQADAARGRLKPAIARLSRRRDAAAAARVRDRAGRGAGGGRPQRRGEAQLRARRAPRSCSSAAPASTPTSSWRSSRPTTAARGAAVVLGRRAWAAAPSVRSADALGWALHRAGHARAALGWARRALGPRLARPGLPCARGADRARRG